MIQKFADSAGLRGNFESALRFLIATKACILPAPLVQTFEALLPSTLLASACVLSVLQTLTLIVMIILILIAITVILVVLLVALTVNVVQ